MAKKPGARSCAALALKDVLVKHHSLDPALDRACKHLQTADISLCKALCYGVCRHFQSLSLAIEPLLDKPLRNKDSDIYALLLIGAYQLSAMRLPEYAAIDSCVNASKELKKPWASGLINAILRKYQAQLASQSLPHHPQSDSEHPVWLYKKITNAWPDYAAAIFHANNQQPPLCIRVNIQKISRSQYLEKLLQQGINASVGEYSSTAIYIQDIPQDITTLPGFNQGECSVQDEAPQLSAFLLNLSAGQRVLDACAAPGGKTCHILETEFALKELIAIDHDADRLQRVSENLQRLNLTAKCIAADIVYLDKWWDGESFDRILCDAPCSATGVIRRHPDIKLLRHPEDIEQLAELQLSILQTLWQCLKPDGILLYATCSILPDENAAVIKQFCAMENSCEEITITENYGIVTEYGRQLLPQVNAHDGFYYARLKKRRLD